VVQPALSDLAAGARLDSILDEDPRGDAEVAERWAHLSPIVQAFYARLGVDTQVDPQAETVTTKAVAKEEEAPMKPEVEPALPPDPGEIFTDAVDTQEVEAVADPIEDEPAEARSSSAAEEGYGQAESPSRVDAESHARLQDDGAGPGLHQAARLLYDDVLWLFTINDGEGALISLERLLTIGLIDDEVSEFLDLNGDKLLGLYEGYIGPFDKVPMRGDITVDAMPAGYLSQGALESVLGMIDGQRSIADLIDSSDRTPLETCASIEQLHRARLVQL
jgi:hypothetical protein